jgi:hypothetical protein
MAPYDACYASLYDTYTEDDGTVYIAKYIKGEMSWVLLNGKQKSKQRKQRNQQDSLPDIYDMCIGDIVNSSGTEYIVKMIHGERQYVLHQKSYKWANSGVLYADLDS